MAIIGLVVLTTPNSLVDVQNALQQYTPITAINVEKHACKIAVVLEEEVQGMEKAMEHIQGIDGVLNTGIAFINFEDDLDDAGRIPCPPHKPRRQMA